MIEVCIDSSGLTRFAGKLDLAPGVISKGKRQAFEATAPKLKALVDKEIGGSGKVQSWQDSFVGSGGGYAAVRPKRKTWTDGSERYAVGYVTNAIENGHRVPKTIDRTQRYKPKLKSFAQTMVQGKYFYRHVRRSVEVEQVAREAVNQVAQVLLNWWDSP